MYSNFTNATNDITAKWCHQMVGCLIKTVHHINISMQAAIIRMQKKGFHQSA